MTTVTRINRPMRKHELIKHLEQEHGQSARVPIIAGRWTKAELVDLHRLIHVGLGR